MLSKFKRRLQTDPVPPALEHTVTELVSRLCTLEDCCLADLHSAATNELDFVRNVLLLPHLPPDLAHIVDPIFKALITVTKTLCSQKRQPADRKAVSPVPVRAAAPSATLVCRICDEPISVELFKCHTRSCISAYKSESRVAAIDDELRRLGDLIRPLLPPGPWPGPQDAAVDAGLPLVHTLLMVDRVLRHTAMNEDCAHECEVAEQALTAALRHVRSTVLNLLLVQTKAAVVDKKRAAIAFEEALYVVRRTQLSGTGRTMDLASITIADFTFIKRISAGAYARVFLAQKRRTGDIYAIKVLPKTEVVQKN
jgi:hypothetical protein